MELIGWQRWREGGKWGRKSDEGWKGKRMRGWDRERARKGKKEHCEGGRTSLNVPSLHWTQCSQRRACVVV